MEAPRIFGAGMFCSRRDGWAIPLGMFARGREIAFQGGEQGMAERTWEEMSLVRLRAAKALLDLGFFRDSISRSYYAAYCAATSRIGKRGSSFAHGYKNPSHEQLPDLILNAGSIPEMTRRKTVAVLRVLRRAREDADYRPHVTIDRAEALNGFQSATRVLSLLEVRDVTTT